MKLPIPISSNGDFYSEVEISRPKTGIIADAQGLLDTGDVFSAIARFISGSTVTISSPEGKVEAIPDRIKTLTRRMPYRSAEYISMMILLLLNEEDDGIEGVYICPRCGCQIIAELDEQNDIDTRDRISELPVIFMDEPEETFTVSLNEPVLIKNKQSDEVLYTVEELEIIHPTLENCIHAYRKHGTKDLVRRQLAIYSEAMVKINDEEVDNKLRNLWGMFIFENLDSSTDIQTIGREVSKYGMGTSVSKDCPNCKKHFEAPINTSNFFASGLQPM